MTQKGGKGGKSLGGMIRSAIFEDTPQGGSDSTSPKPDSSTDVPTFTTSTPTGGFRSQASASASARPGSVNQAMLAEIEEALAKKSSSAYTTFTGLLSSLAAKLPDEATRFAAALAVAPTMKLDADTVLSAFSDRLNILDDLQKVFEDQSREELDRRVRGAQKELDQIDSDLGDTQKEISKLTARAEDLKNQKQQKSAAIARDSENIAGVRQQMLTAFEAVRAKATTERDTVSRHTKGS